MMVWKRLVNLGGVAADRLQMRMAVKLGVTACLSLIVGVSFSKIFDRPDTLVSGLWTVLSSIVVMSSYLGATYLAAWVRLLGTFIGVIIAGLCINFLGAAPAAVGFSVFITVAICGLLRLDDSVRIASITVAVVMVLWGLNPEVSPWAFGLFRFIDSCMGILIAVSVAHTIWPAQATRKVRTNMVDTLNKMRQYYLLAAHLQDGDGGKSVALADEIVAEIADTAGHVQSSRIEIRTRSSLEDWNFLLDHQKELFESISMLHAVDKSKFIDFLDATLAKETDAFVVLLERALIEVATVLAMRRPSQSGVDMESAFLKIDHELDAYRERKSSRFDLKTAESFFVYYYALRRIGGELKKIDGRLKRLYGSDEMI